MTHGIQASFPALRSFLRGFPLRWSLDFVHDQFALGRRFRALNIVADITSECLAAIPVTSISGRRVALPPIDWD